MLSNVVVNYVDCRRFERIGFIKISFWFNKTPALRDTARENRCRCEKLGLEKRKISTKNGSNHTYEATFNLMKKRNLCSDLPVPGTFNWNREPIRLLLSAPMLFDSTMLPGIAMRRTFNGTKKL